MGRTIAIGDIHGCLPALDTLLAAIRPRPDDTIVTLGDYVDRGPRSREVIERLMELRHQCRLVPLLGNHEEMMLQVIDGQSQLYVDWLLFGGEATLQSYGTVRPEDVPPSHVDFLRNCRLFHESERYFYVHGGYLADRPLDDQPREVLLWDSIKKRFPGPHCSGKTAIVGHASQHNGEIRDLGYLKCIDTWCYGDGWLTAMDVDGGQVWQADKNGRKRGE
ncbi:MAG: serine/threonine protein phosphatase [Planctomycetes bacterium]|nr:serine/threonine protein phosphatase [Planctomycetota bacterium]MCG2684322.1 serine/threonine protein phosphatase [Planctomycetales bacterium]